jgi:hypothetical protein
MYPNEISQFFNVAIPLAFSIKPDGMGITCIARDFFDANVSILPLFRLGQLPSLHSSDISPFFVFFNQSKYCETSNQNISNFVDKYKA